MFIFPPQQSTVDFSCPVSGRRSITSCRWEGSWWKASASVPSWRLLGTRAPMASALHTCVFMHFICLGYLQRQLRRLVSSIAWGIQKVTSRWHTGPHSWAVSSASSKAKAGILPGNVFYVLTFQEKFWKLRFGKSKKLFLAAPDGFLQCCSPSQESLRKMEADTCVCRVNAPPTSVHARKWVLHMVEVQHQQPNTEHLKKQKFSVILMSFVVFNFAF